MIVLTLIMKKCTSLFYLHFSYSEVRLEPSCFLEESFIISVNYLFMAFSFSLGLLAFF